MSTNPLFFDIRLQERGKRDKRLTQEALDAQLATIKDRSDNLVEYDADGVPTNLPRRKLKSLAVKPGEPEGLESDSGGPGDMLSEAWDDLGD